MDHPMEDAQPSQNDSNTAPANGTATDIPNDSALKPRDARLLHLLLTSLQVSAYSPRVPIQLLDFAYRYTHGILQDAQAYADHANGQGSVINVEDMRLAVSS